MTRPVEYLDLDDVLGLAILLLGDPPPIRDVGLLGSAIARPQATAFGRDAYPGLWDKAAALLDSVVNNHALIDGNKRLGWLATATFLELNRVKVTTIADDDVFELVMRVASERLELETITRELRHLAEHSRRAGG